MTRASIIRWSWSGAALAAAMAIGGCGTSKLSADAVSGGLDSPLAHSAESFLHAISVEAVQCGPPAGRRREESCQVEFTDSYGEWWATLVVARSTVISDPGGVSDWLCATSCANPPAMTANTGNPRNNPGFTAATGSTGHGQIGVTGVSGVVNLNSGGSGTGVTGNGVVYGTGSTGAPASSAVTGAGNSNGVVYGTGSTGAGANTGGSGVVGKTGSNGVVYGTGSTGPGATGSGR